MWTEKDEYGRKVVFLDDDEVEMALEEYVGRRDGLNSRTEEVAEVNVYTYPDTSLEGASVTIREKRKEGETG